MIWIIISWVYITVVSFLIGCLFTSLLRKIFRIQAKEDLHFSFVCINGFLFTSFIISVWVLFYKVDLLANIFILLLALTSFLIYRDDIKRSLKIYAGSLKKTSKALWFFFMLFVLVMACIAYMPSSHADDAGCFSPLIKWMQEYGAVPGIANLDARFGYNSTWFGLQALYGFAFTKAGLFNDLNGLLFLYILIYSFQGIDRLLNGESSFFNYLRAFFFLPVLFIYFGYSDDFMLYSIQFFTSPTYDIPVTFILWMLFFLFLEQKEYKEAWHTSVRFYMIILYVAWLVTVKLNAIPAIIIALFPLTYLLKEKRYKNAFTAMGSCFLIGIPWVMKTVISCGYLLFPFVELDILNVDWQLTPRAVLYIENSVMTWAIDPELYGSSMSATDTAPFSVSVKEWFPVWFAKQNYVNTVMFFTVILSGLVYLVYGILQWFKEKKDFFSKHAIDIVFALTIIAGIFLWFTKGPLFRYGYAYLLFFSMIATGRFVYYFTKAYHSAYIGIIILAYLFYAGIYYGVKLKEPFAETIFKNPPGISSPEYIRHDFGDGKYINVVKEPFCGNAPLPSSAGYVFDFLQPAYRGKTIKDGFINQRPAEEYKLKK